MGKNKTYANLEVRITLIVGLLTLFVFAIQTVILYQQTNLQQKLLTIQNESTINNYPKLQTSINYYTLLFNGTLYFHKNEICAMTGYDDMLEIYIQNVGGQDTGTIYFYYFSTFLDFQNNNTNSNDAQSISIIDNLVPRDNYKRTVYFRGTQSFCKSNDLSPQYIEVIASCPLCKNEISRTSFKVEITT